MQMAKRNGAKTEVPAPEPTGGNKPVYEIRMGRIRVSVWKNTNSKQETWFSCVLTRGYKDAQGEWKNSHSLGLDDLLVAGEVLKQAALWIYAERQRGHGAEAPEVSELPIPD